MIVKGRLGDAGKINDREGKNDDRAAAGRAVCRGNIKCHSESEKETLAGRKAPDEEQKEEPHKPEYDSDYIKINDRLLSYLFRRRMNTEATDPDLMELWRENNLPNFGRLRVIDNTGNMEAALDAKGWARFRDGDWIDHMEEILKMTEEERAEWIEQQRKEGKR